MSYAEFWLVYDVKRPDAVVHDWTQDREILDELGIKELTPITGKEAEAKKMRWQMQLGMRKK